MFLRPGTSQRYEDSSAQVILDAQRRREANLLNSLLERHPLGCPVSLFVLGVILVISALVFPVSSRLKVALILTGGPFLVFGGLLLLLWLGDTARRALWSALALPRDPALIVLESFCDGRIVRYEESKAEMTQLLVEELHLSPEIARDQVDRLEGAGKLIYLPSGLWVLDD